MEKKTRKSQSNGKASLVSNVGIPDSQLMKLFEDELKEVYWAEKALTKEIPKMIKNTSSEELIDALEGYLKETKEQVTRLEQVFGSIDKKAVAGNCEAMVLLLVLL